MRKQSGQSMVEYALGLGCVSAVCMAALSTLRIINWSLLHNLEHALVPGHGSGKTSGHAKAIVNASQTPWIID